MGTLKSSLLSALGFFVPTLILFTTLNLTNMPHIGSATQGLLFSLYFAAVFFGGLYGGFWAFQLKQEKRMSKKSFVAIIVGALMGDIAWAVITVLWILPVVRDSYFMVLNSIFINSLIVFFSGIAAGGVSLVRIYNPATE